VLGLAEAAHTEYEPDAAVPLIALASCPVEGRAAGAARLSGRLSVRLEPGTTVFRIYGQAEIHEVFACNYELNPAFQAALEAGGLRITGVGERGEARVCELPGHPFFVPTLFLPQQSSTAQRPHPFISAYVRAVRHARPAARSV
jgi:CTP synthase (UTP-ammonia lyase)